MIFGNWNTVDKMSKFGDMDHRVYFKKSDMEKQEMCQMNKPHTYIGLVCPAYSVALVNVTNTFHNWLITLYRLLNIYNEIQCCKYFVWKQHYKIVVCPWRKLAEAHTALLLKVNCKSWFSWIRLPAVWERNSVPVKTGRDLRTKGTHISRNEIKELWYCKIKSYSLFKINNTLINFFFLWKYNTL